MTLRILVFYFLFFLSCYNFYSQNNLILFSETSENFKVEYQSKIYPDYPQTDVRINHIYDNPVKIKILFDRRPPIDTLLYLYYPSKPIQNQDVIYLITKNHQLKYLTTTSSANLKPFIPEINTNLQVKTKQEKNIQKIIYQNDSIHPCTYNIDTADFNKVINFIQSNPNVDRKIFFIEKFIKHNCFSQNEAIIILNEIPFEVEKLKIMKELLPKLNNVFDLWYWDDYLKSSIARQSFSEYYQSYLKSIAQYPILKDSLLNILHSKLKVLDNDYFILEETKIILSHYSINYHQLKEIVHYFKHDQFKEQFLQYAFYALNNKKDFEKALDLVNYEDTKKRLKYYYEKQTY